MRGCAPMRGGALSGFGGDSAGVDASTKGIAPAGENGLAAGGGEPAAGGASVDGCASTAGVALTAGATPAISGLPSSNCKPRSGVGRSAVAEGAGALPGAPFWVGRANSVAELIRIARAGTLSGGTFTTDVNTISSRDEEVLREVGLLRSTVAELSTTLAQLIMSVAECQAALQISSPKTIHQAEMLMKKSKEAYAEEIKRLFLISTTATVIPGPSSVANTLNSVMAKEMNISPAEAHKKLDGQRERAVRGSESTKTTSINVAFAKRRSAMFRETGLAAFNAWKRRVEFPVDDQDAAVNAAVEWLHKDRYIKTTVGLEGVVDAVKTVIRDMDVDKTLSVPANQTGEVGYLKAMLGHVSFSSVKVSL